MMSYSMARQMRRATLAARQLRWESTLHSLPQDEIDLQPPFAHWSKVIREAEKIVGYPTSFMNLRWLLSDEFANMALHLRKLVGSDHPLLTTAKSLLYNEQNNLQPWGLIILLLSKSVVNDADSGKLTAQDNRVYEHQRVLAELTEMIRTGHLIHKGLLNIPLPSRNKKTETAVFGNKIGILIGDYLLVTANGMLANLRNQNLSYIISSALRDLSEGEFFGERDVQNAPLPGRPRRGERSDAYEISCETSPIKIDGVLGSATSEWTVRSMYGGASLLGRGCEGAALLAGRGRSCRETAYLFGCHVALAWQATNELRKLENGGKELSLVSAPVLYALNCDPELFEYIDLAKADVSGLNYDELKRKVLKTGAVDRTRLLREDHVKKAIELVTSLGSNESVEAIKKIITTS